MAKTATKTAAPRPRTSSPAKEEPQQEERPPFKPTSVGCERGHLMQFTYWAVVDSARRGSLNVTDVDREDGGFSVTGETLIESSKSANQYDQEVKLSASDLSRKVLEADRIPFTVCFDTKDKSKRVLTGRLRDGDGFRGYANVDELVDGETDGVKDPKNRIRRVDLRELHWLIVDGVKYISKTPPKK